MAEQDRVGQALKVKVKVKGKGRMKLEQSLSIKRG